MSPLVVLHGFTGSPESLAPIAPWQNALKPLLSGHGDAPLTASFASEAERIARLLPRASHLIGYSLGARLALGAALQAPEKLARLTLLSGRPGLANEGERQQRRQRDEELARAIEERGIAWFAEYWQSLPMWESQRPLAGQCPQWRRQERIRRSHHPRGLAGSLRAQGLGAMPNFWPCLAEIKAPCELIAGQLDPLYCQLAREMAQAMPNATVHIAPQCGHNPILEEPEWLLEVLAS